MSAVTAIRRSHSEPLNGARLTEEFVCWSRMQAEAGQALAAIVRRKEMERHAGNGVFCWGVGSAPALAASALAKLHYPVRAVFSVMKGRPKAVDVAPSRTVAWRRFVDPDGVSRILPRNVLVTSRADSANGPKERHFALMCRTENKLELKSGKSFDPGAYRNAGGTGAPVGASQVTALLRRVSAESEQSDYEENLSAWLTAGYWVRLADPIELSPDFNRVDAQEKHNPEDWIEFADWARQSQRTERSHGVSPGMLL
ncbi:MAG: hypothetical protein GY873_37510 [Bosea sp.]|uniref:hypothetical protein n=1 Tax=Bosea sp. (in: a-proteobacteria) TaxID=1871050 RepID=UPI002381ED8D|nr:hypothetical protein [Bosea sp. (in: a-proteobacteria)]MCP4739900.1 hypothetical protein [Bosea sp. (in: a-proteobacteria)]